MIEKLLGGFNKADIALLLPRVETASGSWLGATPQDEDVHGEQKFWLVAEPLFTKLLDHPTQFEYFVGAPEVV